MNKTLKYAMVVIIIGVVFTLIKKKWVLQNQKHFFLKSLLELQITFIAMFLYFFFWNLINEGKEKLYNYKQKLMIGMPSVLYTLSFFMDTFSLSYLNINTNKIMSVLSLFIMVVIRNSIVKAKYQRIKSDLLKMFATFFILFGIYAQQHLDLVNQKQDKRIVGIALKIVSDLLLAVSFVYEEQLLLVKKINIQTIIYYQGIVGTVFTMALQFMFIVNYGFLSYKFQIKAIFNDSYYLFIFCITSLIMYGYYYECQLKINKLRDCFYRIFVLKIKSIIAHLLADFFLIKYDKSQFYEFIGFFLEILGYILLFDIINTSQLIQKQKPQYDYTLNLNVNLIRIQFQIKKMYRLIFQKKNQSHHHYNYNNNNNYNNMSSTNDWRRYEQKDNDTTIEELYLSLNNGNQQNAL